MSIKIKNISKTFGAFKALNNINLDVPTGQLVALLGPSGCGKTTLLRIIAGLEVADTGTVICDNEDTSGKKIRNRQVGFVFQHYALFRHMTVFKNVAFGLDVKPRRNRPSKKEICSKVHSLLKLVQIEHLANYYPHQLSGGQKQRTALARALIVEPKLLLLDEPFGALDARVRQDLRRWLKHLHEEIQVTSIFVTHDQEEAMEVADTIVVMNEGRIEQVGTPEEVYHNPASAFVYNFLGNVNLFHGRIKEGNFNVGDVSLDLKNGTSLDYIHSNEDKAATIFLRPHLLEIDRSCRDNSIFKAFVKDINAAGPQVKIELITSWNDELFVEISQDRLKELDLSTGTKVYVSFDKKNLFVSHTD